MERSATSGSPGAGSPGKSSSFVQRALDSVKPSRSGSGSVGSSLTEPSTTPPKSPKSKSGRVQNLQQSESTPIPRGSADGAPKPKAIEALISPRKGGGSYSGEAQNTTVPASSAPKIAPLSSRVISAIGTAHAPEEKPIPKHWDVVMLLDNKKVPANLEISTQYVWIVPKQSGSVPEYQLRIKLIQSIRPKDKNHIVFSFNVDQLSPMMSVECETQHVNEIVNHFGKCVWYLQGQMLKEDNYIVWL